MRLFNHSGPLTCRQRHASLSRITSLVFIDLHFDTPIRLCRRRNEVVVHHLDVLEAGVVQLEIESTIYRSARQVHLGVSKAIVTLVIPSARMKSAQLT